MVPPIDFDPSGVCVLLTGENGGAFLFHAKILCYASQRMGRFAWQPTDAEDERPVQLEVPVPKAVLKIFKRWAYHGDIEESQLHTLEQVLEVIHVNKEELRVSGFQDALVDRAIRLVTTRPWSEIQQSLDKTVLENLFAWPPGFQRFFVDWTVYLREDQSRRARGEDLSTENDSGVDLEPEDSEQVQKAVHDSLKKRKLPPQFAHEIAMRYLEPKEQRLLYTSEAPWIYNPCAYHDHTQYKGCYLEQGAINIDHSMDATMNSGVDAEDITDWEGW